ncbi:MAG: class I SAM-dependent methyltransferase [Elusimicrobiota bacterium]|nr:class I SAM-dependent methyltransferase [Elusimicrobiota bacterium]
MDKPSNQDVPDCLFCEKPGELQYKDVGDFFFENAGAFSFLRCPSCGLTWLSPRPTPEDMGRFYGDYYTHAAPEQDKTTASGKRFLGGGRDLIRDSILCGYYGYKHIHDTHRLCGIGGFLGGLPFFRNRAANVYKALVPFYREGGRIVDVGCGRGDFLAWMKELGWETLGIETDAMAAKVAAGRGLAVETRPLEKAGLPGDWADEVTMNHVLEHFYDPVSALTECRRILKKGGRLALYTPNAASLGHRVFGREWRGLEPPRHLYIFSPRAILSALSKAGFTDVRVRTSTRLAGAIYNASVLISREGNLKGRIAPRQTGVSVFKIVESCLCALGFPKGEELEVIVYK